MTFKFISRAYVVNTFAELDKKNQWDSIFRKLGFDSSRQEQESELTVVEATSDSNYAKNRYQNVLPYDQHRVKLAKLKPSRTDFINASPLRLDFSDRDYILSQGPLEYTAGDFWQMCWEQNTRIVVMLNNVFEKGSMKCYPYYASKDNEEQTFGDFKLNLEEETGTAIFRIRTMKLTALDKDLVENGEPDFRTIYHFQFTDWPDFGVPSETGAFLDFCKHVSDVEDKLKENNTNSPVVVHCSAGIGRSGAYVVVDSLINYFRKGEGEAKNLADNVPENMNDFVLHIRKHRMGLIQTAEQLRFCWQALNDWVKANPKCGEEAAAELSTRKRQSTSDAATSIEIRKQKIQEMRDKLLRVEENKNKWWRRWFEDEQKRFWIGSSIVAAGATILAFYVYTYK